MGNLLIRHIESHKVEAQDPYLQGLMMSCENGVREIIKACVTVMTLIALPCRFRIVKAALDDLCRLTRLLYFAISGINMILLGPNPSSG